MNTTSKSQRLESIVCYHGSTRELVIEIQENPSQSTEGFLCLSVSPAVAFRYAEGDGWVTEFVLDEGRVFRITVTEWLNTCLDLQGLEQQGYDACLVAGIGIEGDWPVDMVVCLNPAKFRFLRKVTTTDFIASKEPWMWEHPQDTEVYGELEIFKGFAREVAGLIKDGEELDGVEFDMASDDAVDTLHRLISHARSLIGTAA